MSHVSKTSSTGNSADSIFYRFANQVNRKKVAGFAITCIATYVSYRQLENKLLSGGIFLGGTVYILYNCNCKKVWEAFIRLFPKMPPDSDIGAFFYSKLSGDRPTQKPTNEEPHKYSVPPQSPSPIPPRSNEQLRPSSNPITVQPTAFNSGDRPIQKPIREEPPKYSVPPQSHSPIPLSSHKQPRPDSFGSSIPPTPFNSEIHSTQQSPNASTTPKASSPRTGQKKNKSSGTPQPFSHAQGNRPIMKDKK